MNLISFKKFVCAFIIFNLLFVQIASAEIAHAAVKPASLSNDVEVMKDLVVIVMDTEIDKDTSSYVGLKKDYPDELKEDSLGERVLRYAEDIKENNDLTDVKILLFDKKKEEWLDMANALENI